jgi:hypothetical protein
MENDLRAWPLQMVFIVALIGGAAGLVEPKLFDAGSTPGRTIPWILAAVAVVSALTLYIPVFRAVLRVSAGVGTPDNPADGTLLARIGATTAPLPGTVLGRLGSLAEATGSLANPQAGTLVARLGNLEAIAAALGTLADPQPGTLLARLGHLETIAAAIGTPADPQPGTEPSFSAQARAPRSDSEAGARNAPSPAPQD